MNNRGLTSSLNGRHAEEPGLEGVEPWARASSGRGVGVVGGVGGTAFPPPPSALRLPEVTVV